MTNQLPHPHLPLPITPTPQQITLVPRPGRSPTAPRQRGPRRTPGPGRAVRRRAQVEAPRAGQHGRDVVDEGGGGGHAAAEDGGGEFAGGPEGRGLEVVRLVRVAGVEGDDEAHDGGDAGAGARVNSC